jgi:hypothetical protein
MRRVGSPSSSQQQVPATPRTEVLTAGRTGVSMISLTTFGGRGQPSAAYPGRLGVRGHPLQCRADQPGCAGGIRGGHQIADRQGAGPFEKNEIAGQAHGDVVPGVRAHSGVSRGVHTSGIEGMSKRTVR